MGNPRHEWEEVIGTRDSWKYKHQTVSGSNSNKDLIHHDRLTWPRYTVVVCEKYWLVQAIFIVCVYFDRTLVTHWWVCWPCVCARVISVSVYHHLCPRWGCPLVTIFAVTAGLGRPRCHQAADTELTNPGPSGVRGDQWGPSTAQVSGTAQCGGGNFSAGWRRGRTQPGIERGRLNWL